MSDQGVIDATMFNHYYGEGDDEFIEWTILKDGEEIVNDVMSHKRKDASPFTKKIQWDPETKKVDYFGIFFDHFFPSLAGKAATLDKYLSDPRCSGHQSYWVKDKVQFNQPNNPDPDYLVSFFVLPIMISLCYSSIEPFVLVLLLQLKICVTLVITASLEVEHGVENLWSTVSNGFKLPPDYGQFIPQHYFCAFVCGFPHLWSPEHLWYSEAVPWECFLPFVQAFNQQRHDLLMTVYLLLDESMSTWRPKTSKSGGLPNITFEPRKPKPLGTMFKNGVEATTGIMVTQAVVEGADSQREKNTLEICHAYQRRSQSCNMLRKHYVSVSQLGL